MATNGNNPNGNEQKGTDKVKRGLAQMLKGGVIMDVVTAEQAKIAEDAGAVAVMALEAVPADIRKRGGVARMADPGEVEDIIDSVSIPVMGKARIGHRKEAEILEAVGVDMIDESEVLTPADDRFHTVCYHTSLEPFMQRGRDLAAQGYDGAARDSIRQAEIDAGTLPMPEQAAALYSLTTRADRYDLTTGEIGRAHVVRVIYLPYATVESTGLPPKAPAGEPWIMEPGTPWAHIMLVGTHGDE